MHVWTGNPSKQQKKKNYPKLGISLESNLSDNVVMLYTISILYDASKTLIP